MTSSASAECCRVRQTRPEVRDRHCNDPHQLSPEQRANAGPASTSSTDAVGATGLSVLVNRRYTWEGGLRHSMVELAIARSHCRRLDSATSRRDGHARRLQRCACRRTGRFLNSSLSELAERPISPDQCDPAPAQGVGLVPSRRTEPLLAGAGRLWVWGSNGSKEAGSFGRSKESETRTLNRVM